MASSPPPERKKPARFQKGRPLDFNIPSLPRMRAMRPEPAPQVDETTTYVIDVDEPEPKPKSLRPKSQSIRPKAQSVRPQVAKSTARDELVLRWASVLDRVDYLALLKIPPSPSVDGPGDADVRKAFHAFAAAFHPDHYRESRDEVRAAAARIYDRGGEAYRVLLDPLLRKRYLRLLGEGVLRMSAEELEPVAVRLDPARRETIEEIAKTAGARPFAVRADQLVASGDLRHARLQVQLALTREPDNTRLSERLRELDDEIARGPRRNG